MNFAKNRTGQTTLASALALLACVAGTARAQTDYKIPLNYNAHIMAKPTEALQGAIAINADLATNQYRSMADRGYFWDTNDPNSIGGLPLVGNTGITYGMFNTLGYGASTWPNAASGGFDAVFMGNRVLNGSLELSGSQAFSNNGPFPAWAPPATITGLTFSGTTVTAATSSPHGFKVGETVLVSGIAPAALSGNFAVTAIPDSTHFSFVSLATTGGAAQMYANNIRVSSASLTAGVLTVTCSASHGLATGDSVTLSGIASAGSPTYGYNGSYSATVTSATAFTVPISNGTTGTASARMYMTFGGVQTQISSITTATSDLSQVTVTTSAAHGLAVGNSVAIDGVNPFAYDATYTVVSVADTTHFNVAITPIGGMFANGVAATSIKGSGSAFTVTTDTAPSTAFAVGGYVNISGSSVAGFNGQWVIASVPNTTSFTVTSAVTGTATNRPGTLLAAGTLDRSSLDQVTAVSPTPVDANSVLGLTYMTSNSGGPFDVVMTFNNGVTDTNVTARVTSPDWFSDPADVAIIAQQPPVLSQKKVTHKVGAAVTQIVGDGSNAVATCNAAAGFKVGETVTISGSSNFNGPQVITAVPSPFAISSFATAGGVVTAATSAAHGYSVGDVVTVMGTSTNGWNGTYTISAVTDTTHFSYVNPTTGTSTTAAVVKPQFTFASATAATDSNSGMRAVDNNTASGYVGITSPIAVATGVATVTTSAPHGFTSGQTVVISNTTYALPTATTGALYGPQVITVTDATHFTFNTAATANGTGTMFAGGNRTFRGTNNADANQNQGWAYGQSNWGGGPNLNLTEAVISVPASVAGQNLTKLAFRNATWTTTTLSALSGNGTTATATWTDPGTFIGQTIVITGANPATFNGTYVIASKPTSTTFTFACPVNGAATTAGVAGRAGVGKGYSIYAATLRTGIPNQANASCSSATVVTTSPTTHLADLATDNLTSGISSPVVTTDDITGVWFSYTAPATGVIQAIFSTCTSAFDTTLAVYTNCAGSPVASNDDTSGCGTGGSKVLLTLVNGQTYYIRVAGKAGARGTFTLHIDDTPAPANSLPSTAAAANAGTGPSGDNAGTLDHALTDGFTTIPAATDTMGVWYQRVASGSGAPYIMEARTCLDGQDVTLTPAPQMTGVTGVRTTSASNGNMVLPLDTTIAVYAGIPSPSSTPVASNDDGCSVSSRVRWTATPGVQYFIRVGVKAAVTGTAAGFVLHVDDPVHTDLTVPIQFNWNGICHGTTTDTTVSEQTIPDPAGTTHENRCDLNGYRSIADRSLLFDPNGTTTNALNYGGTIGYQGMAYQVYNIALQSDMIHLGNRNLAAGGIRAWSATCPSGSTTNSNGMRPLWLNNDDQTTIPQTSNVSGMHAVWGSNTKLGFLYHMSNVDTVSNNGTNSVAQSASFDVVLGFSDGQSVTVTVPCIDWFGGASQNPYQQSLPVAASGSGMESLRVLGIYRGTQNTDRGTDGGSSGNELKVEEVIISTSSLSALGFDPTMHGMLQSITFQNMLSGNAAHDTIYSAVGIYASALRDPASYNLTYPPNGVGTLTPNNLNAGGTGKITVAVSRGSGTPNNITSVVVDASAIGLSSTFALNDSGTSGDTQANDNTWSRNVSFPVNTLPNSFSLPFTVTDAQSRTAMGNIIFTVVAPTGTFTPSTGVVAGVTQVHAQFVFGTTGGISSVLMDLSQLGLSPSTALLDNGTGGDTTANDGTWGVNFTPSGTTATGTYLIPYTITDTGSNVATGTISISIIPPPPANDVCSGAIPLFANVTYSGDNTYATTNDGTASTCMTSVSKGVWFSFTTGPSDAGAWLFSSCGTTQDTVLTVYNAGATCANADTNQMACNDDNGVACTGNAASVQVTLAASSTYLVRLESYLTTATGGAFSLIVTPYVTGACCNNTTGACTQVAATACSSTTSSYQGDNVACPTTCAVTGACCDNTTGACTFIYGGFCATGTFAGANTACDANTCPPSGICCNNTTGACTFSYANGCAGSTTAGTGVTCGAGTPSSSCAPVGTCCDNTTGACTLLYGGLCPANGNFNSALACTPTTCPQFQWACCFADGSCLSLYQNDCGSHAGATWAPGQTCGVYACPSCTNILANPGAEAGDLSGWIIDVSGGNGWQAGQNTGDIHTGSYYFATSYGLSRRHQLIDLTQYMTASQLDAAPDIGAGEYVHTRGDQAGQYYILVQLLAADQTTVIASFNDGTATALTQLPNGTPYTLISHTFSAYGPGARYLRFEDGGRDVSGWAGFYGTHFDDAFAGPTQTTAACCSPTTGCSVISNADCITAGGTPQACGTTCSPSSCPGVCCRGATCSTAFTSPAACAAATVTSATTGPGWAFVSSTGVCNAGVNPDGTYSSGLSSIQTPCCFANYNHNAGLEIQDIFDFLNDWFAGRPIAIPGGNGASTTGLAVQNIFNFLNAWFAGNCH